MDTFHPFELSCERELALPLLKDIKSKYFFANEAEKALLEIVPMDPSLVPADSLIREFIGGGIYAEHY